MDGEGLQPPGNEPVDGDAGQSAEKMSKVGEAHKPDTSGSSMPDHVGEAHGKENETQEVKPPVGCPPTDWLEPLEDDEQGEDDGESVAGESEKSHAVIGSESANKTLSR